MQIGPIKMSDLLTIAENLPVNHGIFGKFQQELSHDTEVLVASFDDLGEDEDEPIEARNLGFVNVITSTELKSIIENMNLQKITPSIDDYLKAISFYVENDAFVVIL
jgi:hypothetical protein